MGYLHINNLYKDQLILQFKRIYALEKIHGTSAHIKWRRDIGWPEGILSFFSGGEKFDNFVSLFDADKLKEAFIEKFGYDPRTVVIYGEAYGGKQQGMSHTYGPDLKFVAFDVQVDDTWLQVEQAHGFCRSFGIEFVDYEQIEATLEEIDRCRDLPSTQAVRNGVTDPKIREGVVLRPPFEVILNNGSRLIAKHKRDEFRETKSPRVVDPSKAALMDDAVKIAEEWVTPMRLEHVIDQLIRDREYKRAEMSDIGALIKLMYSDVLREGQGEILASRDLNKAIGAQTVRLFKQHIDARLRRET